MLRPTPRVAISAIFFLNGAMFSAWYARVPAISDRLDLSPGEIGVALLGAPLGLLLAQPLAGPLVARRGSYALLRLAPVAMVAIALPALAVDLPTLAFAVLLTGATNGVLDITMNAQGLAVERAAGRGLLTLRAAGGEPHSGPELAAVSTLGSTGFLLGPPFIGVLAEVSGLGAALLVVSAALLLTAVLARALRPAAARA